MIGTRMRLLKWWMIFLGCLLLLVNSLSFAGVRTESETFNNLFFWAVMFCFPVAFLMIGRACRTMPARIIFIIPGALCTLSMFFVIMLVGRYYLSDSRRESGRNTENLAEWRDGDVIYRVESRKSGWAIVRDATVLYRDNCFFPGLTFRSHIKSFHDTSEAQIISLSEDRLRLILPKETLVFDFDR